MLEELIRQKHIETKQNYFKIQTEKIDMEEAFQHVNIPRVIITTFSAMGIMLLLITGLIISQIRMNAKYENLVQSISENSIPVMGGEIEQDEKIINLENNLAQIEKNMDSIIEKFNRTENEINTLKKSVPQMPDTTNNAANNIIVNAKNNTAGNTINNTKNNTTDNTIINTADISSKDGKYMEYTVQEGDTLWNLSIRFYGDGKKNQELMRINGFKSPDDLEIGQTILVPSTKDTAVD